MKTAFNKIRNNRVTIPFMPFYRKHPYRGNVSITSVDARGCVDMELGFFYNRIPKAANSTVVTNLARIKYGRDITSKVAKKLFRNPSGLNNREVTAFDALFKFTIVRNPYTRILSAYLDKVERRALKAGKETSFKGFLHSLKNGKLYTNAHWAPQSTLLLLPLDQFDFIGKVETLGTDLPFITEKIQGKPPQHSFKSFLRNATGANQKMHIYYDSESIDLMRQLYQADFNLFNYPEQPPVATDILSGAGQTES